MQVVTYAIDLNNIYMYIQYMYVYMFCSQHISISDHINVGFALLQRGFIDLDRLF